MRKYFILAFVISILGHGIFFGIFKGTLPVQAVSSIPKLYIIPSGQIRHEMTRNIALTPLFSRLSEKNPIWADTIHLSKSIDEVYCGILEEPLSLPLKKTHMLQKLPSSVEWNVLSNEKILPRFSDMFYYKLPSEIVSTHGEQVINLSNDIQLSYYIRGPISGRNLQITNLSLEVDRMPVELKLRFWVARNGRVNQVIIEEGSGFPIIDKKIVDAIKHWRFRPVYVPSAPKYQWGIIKIRIQI